MMWGRGVCFGELLLRLGAPGRQLLLQSPQLDVCAGGIGASVAVPLAKLGHDAVMVDAAAGNAPGEVALGELRRHGVDTRNLRKTEGRVGVRR